MNWVFDRYGLEGDDGNEGDPQYDVYETFFTQDAVNRFRLSPAEYEILKANDDKAKKKKEEDKSTEEKDKNQATAQASAKETETGKEDENQPPKLEPIKIDLNRIEDRTVQLN